MLLGGFIRILSRKGVYKGFMEQLSPAKLEHRGPGIQVVVSPSSP